MKTDLMTTADLMPFLRAHECFRRDLGRILEALQDAAAPARLRAIADFWVLLTDLLEHHHRTEDDNILPALLANRPSAAAALAEMEHEHRELHEALTDAAPVFGRLDDGDPRTVTTAAACARRVRDIVAAHLAAEEDRIVPLFLECFSADEWQDLELRTTDALIRDELLAFALPWATEGLSREQTDAAVAALPQPLQRAYGQWEADYDVRAAAIRPERTRGGQA